MLFMHRPRARALVLCAVSAVAAAAVVTGAASPASARIPERTIKSECRDAGGTYTSYLVPGDETATTFRYSQCAYRDIDGNRYTDYYADGEYTGTSP